MRSVIQLRTVGFPNQQLDRLNLYGTCTTRSMEDQ